MRDPRISRWSNAWDEIDFFKHPKKDTPLTSRERREYELKGMLASHIGRNELTQLLRQYLNIPSGQIPPGTPFVETILGYEFTDQPVLPTA